jgi:predicted acetyltransferase
MNYHLIPASKEYEEVIKNLMQFYIYDFSEFVACDVENDGLYTAYTGLDLYWKEINHRFPYLITKDEKYIGFVLVRKIESLEKTYFSIAEFFIMRKYRRLGIGGLVAKEIFDLHTGKWEVFQKENNKPAQSFWTKIIHAYTQGQFSAYEADGKRIQNFEN